jgi:hypothetical protein
MPPEIWSSPPRKVGPRGIAYVLVATGSLFVVLSWVLPFLWLGRQDPSLKTVAAVVVLFDALALFSLVFLPLGKLRKEAHLLKWGVATSAIVVSRSIATGRSGNHLELRYEFTDDSGRRVRGARVLWGDIQLNGRTSDPKILDALAAPTVFYDRNNSQAHLFYPAALADIRS